MQISSFNPRIGGCIPASPEPGNSRVDPLEYTCISLNVPPAISQGDFAFIAGTSAINAQIFPCNLRSGGCIRRCRNRENSWVAPLAILHLSLEHRRQASVGAQFMDRAVAWAYGGFRADLGSAPCPRAPSTAEVLIKVEYRIVRCKFSGTSKWNPGHARPHLTRGSPSPFIDKSCVESTQQICMHPYALLKTSRGKKEGRGEKILKKNP